MFLHHDGIDRCWVVGREEGKTARDLPSVGVPNDGACVDLPNSSASPLIEQGIKEEKNHIALRFS